MSAHLIGNGGLGHAIEARYRVDGYPGFLGLQVVQVFYGTPTDSDPPGLYEFDLGGQLFRGYVDGGRKSRNALQNADAERIAGEPYHYSENQLHVQQNYDFNSQTGVGSIKVYDVPMGMRIHDEGYFETAIVAIPQQGPDQIVIALRWGWVLKGMVYKPAHNQSLYKYEPLVSTNVSPVFRDILNDNYHDYVIGI